MSRPTHTTHTCPNCGTDFDRLPLDYDEDGQGYAVLETQACAEATCGKLLCHCCESFQCDSCGELYCQAHLVLIPDGADRPLRCCAACAAEGDELVAPMPPARETQPDLARHIWDLACALNAEAAARLRKEPVIETRPPAAGAEVA